MRPFTRFLLLALLLLPSPVIAQDLRPAEPSILYFFSAPFGGESRRDREPVFGLSLQGRKTHQSLQLDSRF